MKSKAEALPSQATVTPAEPCVFWSVAFPFWLTAGLIPVVVYQRLVPLDVAQADAWIGTSLETDFFTFYKARLLVFLALWGVLGQLDGGPPQPRTWWRVPFFVYAGAAVLSTFLSEHPWTALFGAPMRSEGLFVLLAYAWVGLTGLSLGYHSFPAIRGFGWALGCSGVIAGGIGLMQAIGIDVFRQGWWRWLIFQEEFKPLASRPELVATGTWAAFSTFANSNYCGSFAALVLVFFLALAFFAKGLRRYWLILVHAILLGFLLGSRSKAGWLGCLCGTIGILVVGRRIWRRQIPLLMCWIALAMFLVFALDFASLKKGGEMERFLTQFSSQKISHSTYLAPDFETIRLASEAVEVLFRSGYVKIGWNGDRFEFFDRSGQVGSVQYRGNLAVFPEGRLHGFVIKVASEAKIVKVERGEVMVHFQYTKWGFHLVDGRGKPHLLRPVEHWGFDGRERWGNGRGFIWSRTFPLLKRTWLLGFGPDTFLLYFPNHDFISTIKAGYGTGWLVDKPHNWFLQVAVNTGGVSLLAVLALLGAYLVQSAKLYVRAEFEDPREVYGVALALAIFSYVIVSFFNDSVVGVAPVFWGMLGAGIGLNLSLEKRRAQMRNGNASSLAGHLDG
jgi:hypothetical protein